MGVNQVEPQHNVCTQVSKFAFAQQSLEPKLSWRRYGSVS